jgi:hypothetical protein
MMKSLPRAVLGCMLAAALAAGGGCGIFKSSTSQASFESSSRSSSSPFESSSKSSGGASSALARDVRDYSASYARAGGDPVAFRRDVGAIARAYGVFDWESDPHVHRAMGHGFQQAGLDVEEARRLGVAVSGRDATRLAWVLTGSESDPPE